MKYKVLKWLKYVVFEKNRSSCQSAAQPACSLIDSLIIYLIIYLITYLITVYKKTRIIATFKG